ncbi:hypothetical protein [Roseovarius sp.]|jgi:hypothetical protein
MTKFANTPARSALAIVLGATLTAAALPAAASQITEVERLPMQISKAEFQSLSAPELYEIDIAQKRGQRVQIGDYSLSQSQAVVDEALNIQSDDTVSRNRADASGSRTAAPIFPETAPNPR